jgi:hypothetical protein
VAGVAAGLQVSVQILEPKHSSALVQEPIAATIDSKSALEDQSTRRFCWSWVCPCLIGPAWYDESVGESAASRSASWSSAAGLSSMTAASGRLQQRARRLGFPDRPSGGPTIGPQG